MLMGVGRTVLPELSITAVLKMPLTEETQT